MWFFDWLYYTLDDLGRYFHRVADEAYNILIVGDELEVLFDWIGDRFYLAAGYIAHASDWADDVQSQLGKILSWDTIVGYIEAKWSLTRFILDVKGDLRNLWWDLDSLWSKSLSFLSWDQILTKLHSYFPWLGDPEVHFWSYILDRIEEKWGLTTFISDVKAWFTSVGTRIDEITRELRELADINAWWEKLKKRIDELVEAEAEWWWSILERILNKVI